MKVAVIIIELDWVSHVVYFQWLKAEYNGRGDEGIT